MQLLRLLKRDLSSAASDWISKDIITREQGEQILSLYGVKLPKDGESHNRGYLILMSLAALMVSLAIIVIIGNNWEEIPRWIRMGMMISVVATCNGIGFYKYSKNEIASAKIVLFMGSLMYGAAIMLIAQIYHIEEHFPNGIFMWAIGVLPVALILKSRAILLVVQILSLIWMILEFGMGYLPLLYMGFSFSFFYFAIKIKPSIIVFLFALAGLATFFEFFIAYFVYEGSHNGATHWGAANVIYSTALLLILTKISRFFEGADYQSHIVDYSLITRIWAFRLGIIFLFVLSFERPMEEFLLGAYKIETFSSVFVLLSFVILSALHLMQTLKNRKLMLGGAEIIEAMAAVLLLACGLSSMWLSPESVIVFVLAVNLILLFAGLLLLVDGMKTLSGVKFHGGLSIILLLAIMRYFDLIGDYLGGAAIFATAGIIMFFAAKYWKKFKTKQQEVRA